MTKKRMYFKMITGSLFRRRSRMMMALLAIAIGSTVLFGLLTIYYDIPRQMSTVFRSYGANMIFIPLETENKITQAQCDAVKKAIDPAKLVGFAPYIYKQAKVHEQPYMIAATSLDDAKKNSPYWLICGQWPVKPKEVLIGSEISKTVNLSVGDTVVIDTPQEASKHSREMTVTECTVSGIVTTGGIEEAFIFMDLETVKQCIGYNDVFDVIECSIDGDRTYLQTLAAHITRNTAGISPRMVKRVTESQDTVLNKLQALVWIVTVIVLFLTMICVSTTMMAVVVERRKEIGLKKALGASNVGVITDFLGEAVLLGFSGGILGTILGYVFANRVSISVFARKVFFPVPLVPVTVAASVLITVAACLFPVHTAVDVDPALVLRGE